MADTPVPCDTEAEAEAAPALREQATDALARLQAELGTAPTARSSSTAAAFGDVVVRVRRDAWRQAAQVCKEQARLRLPLVHRRHRLDADARWSPKKVRATPPRPRSRRNRPTASAGSDGRYQLFAVVESTRRKSWRVILKTDLPDDDLHADSWVSVYPGADWHEREAWEMYGFVFDGHPSLRHLYLPSEFEGHPLRKDYPLLAREVKPWPGLVDVEPMPGEAGRRRRTPRRRG